MKRKNIGSWDFFYGYGVLLHSMTAMAPEDKLFGATLANQPDDEKPPTALQSGKRPTEQQNLFETFESRPP